jgi:hypothetical protein
MQLDFNEQNRQAFQRFMHDSGILNPQDAFDYVLRRGLAGYHANDQNQSATWDRSSMYVH